MMNRELAVQGIDHLSLSVTNLNASARFYGDVLGFELQQVPLDYPNTLNAGAYYFVVGETEITLLSHVQTPEGEQFSEYRVGLDHLSFAVESRRDLEVLVGRLNEAEIENEGIKTYQPSQKQYVVVRDPDNIQIEFWLNRI